MFRILEAQAKRGCKLCEKNGAPAWFVEGLRERIRQANYVRYRVPKPEAQRRSEDFSRACWEVVFVQDMAGEFMKSVARKELK